MDSAFTPPESTGFAEARIVLAMSGLVVSAPANAASQQVFWTFCGWYDNTPPGGDIAYRGGPKLWHFDAWVGGKGGNAMNAIDCEDALTNYHDDGKPVMEETIINLQVDPTPIFTTSTGKCLQGGSLGVQLTTATCSGSEKQQFKFHGAFME